MFENSQKKNNCFLRAIPTLKHYFDIVSDIPSGSIYSIFILTFYLTFFLDLSGIYSDILSGIYSDNFLAFILANILTFFLAFYPASILTF